MHKLTNNKFVIFVTRRKGKNPDGSFIRSRVGAVVGVVEGDTLSLGWSLCNTSKKTLSDGTTYPGDRFNPELAVNLAEGRARNLHKYHLTYNIKDNPTVDELIKKGVPQSTINALADVVQVAMQKFQVKNVKIYCDRQPIQNTPTLAWNAK